jgi:hypothetical protein
LLAFTSCKEDTILDASVVPVGDNAFTVALPDTFTILSKTVKDDSLVTSLSITGVPIFHGVGRVTTDQYAGDVNASLYFQVIPPTLGYVFPKTPDSAFLVLPYGLFTWGDTTASNISQQFEVYEVTDSLAKDTTYYTSTEKAFSSTAIGSASVGFSSLKDSVTVLGVKRTPHLRIKLSQAFVDKIKNEAANGTALKSYADFFRFLKGIHVRSTTPGNSLFYFFLNGASDFTRANIQFYYIDKTAANVDTVKYSSFFFDQNLCAHYNKVDRKYNTAGIQAVLAQSGSSDSINAIHNEPGGAIDLKFPFIKYLPKQPIIKAELVITQVTSDFTTLPGMQLDDYQKYFAPARLFPVGVSSTGTTYTIMDRFPTSSTEPLIFIDGQRKDVTINGKTLARYTINIPREVQKAIVEQRDTLHLRINGAVTFPGAYRVLTGGRNLNNTDLRVKLNIVYSKI